VLKDFRKRYECGKGISLGIVAYMEWCKQEQFDICQRYGLGGNP